MTARITGLAVAALATTALAVAASPTLGDDGQKVRVESKITIRFAGLDTFGGRVISNRVACRIHRKVKVYFRRPGEGRRLARTKTSDREGGWTQFIPNHGEGTNHFAIVTREVKGGYICLRDKSGVITY